MIDGSPGSQATSTSVPIRRDVVSLIPDGPEIASLRRGVRALRDRAARDQGDPTGWLAQANIHRDHCSHATWWFLPWHRAYLYYFEQILREAAGDPSLTLPYWNWTKDPRLPQAYWGSDNPLNDATRGILPETEVDAGFVGGDVIDAILGTADFFTFASARSDGPLRPVGYGNLEGTPHNYIHRFVGVGGGNMGNPDRAAQDPIFWLHHANVDRLWTEWATRNPTRTPNDAGWLAQSFSFFDTQGNPVSIKTSDTLDTRNLDYRYDTQTA